MSHETDAAYAAYVSGNLARIAVINMQEYNYTGTGEPAARRPSGKYTFRLSDISVRSLSVQRLLANGSDSISGISWDGWSYNYELKGGAPVRLGNITIGETVNVGGRGEVEVELPYSSAVILSLDS
jgi:hypothetical protein